MTKNRRIILKYDVLKYLKIINTLIEKGKLNGVFNIYDIENEFELDNKKLGAILKKAQIMGLLNNEGRIKINSGIIKHYSISNDGTKEIEKWSNNV